MRGRSDERGQSTILVALSLTCILSFTGLAVDVGTLFHAKRSLQMAADAGAIAAATEAAYSSPADMTPYAAASAAVAANGFAGASSGGTSNDGNGQQNTSDGVTLTVNNPPQSGPHTSPSGTANGYVEVIVSQSQRTTFMGILGFASVPVTGRAVAVKGYKSSGCIYVLDPNNDADAMLLQGSFDVSAPACGIVVDSTSGSALDFKGNGGTLTAGSVGVVGGATGHTGDSTPAPVTGIPPASDPLPTLPAPTATGCSSATSLTGAVASGCYSAANITISNATLSGTYVFSNTSGSVTLSGSVTGTGVTLYLGGALTEATGTSLNLVAPTSGTYQGILIYGAKGTGTPPSATLTFEVGNATGSLTGIIYAPTDKIFLHDSGGGSCTGGGGLSLTTDLIVYQLDDQTASLCMQSYSQSNPSITPLTKTVLVE